MNLADGAEFIEPGDVERLRNVDNLSVQVEKQAVELEDWIAALELEPFGDDLGGGNGGYEVRSVQAVSKAPSS